MGDDYGMDSENVIEIGPEITLPEELGIVKIE
jgi:hypothetical protein